MNTKKFEYKRTTVRLVVLSIHPVVDMFPNNEITPTYLKEAAFFNHYDCPVVTIDNKVLTHPESFISASENGLKEIEVIVIENISEKEITRMICYGQFQYHKRNNLKFYLLINFLINQLEIYPEWAKEIETEEENADYKVAAILGCSRSTVYRTRYVGNFDLNLFDRVENEEDFTMFHAYQIAQQRKGGKIEKEPSVIQKELTPESPPPNLKFNFSCPNFKIDIKAVNCELKVNIDGEEKLDYEYCLVPQEDKKSSTETYSFMNDHGDTIFVTIKKVK
ncbi:hypothetical protein [Limnovirga soli]|uniref:Uncharacterized protein n=1 Tax=Limnovirga soli TaxID=2656915 RepID=A0A8J8FGX1_9BACT|nr:hypothetical protein [Limnovirga soli]NNV57207.1 hypothetical protein [Limnovirga soli]